jgi:hypothetical protein
LGAKPEAVITRSPYGESVDNAIQSILRCKYLVGSRIHIVNAGFNPAKDITPASADALANARLEIVLHGSKLKADKVGSLAVIHVPPELEFHPSAVERLIETMENTHYKHTHFAISTNVEFESGSWFDPSAWIAASAYGLLNVILMIDIVRSILNLTKYHRTCDLRAQTLTLSWPHDQRLSHRSSFRWLVWTGVSGVSRAEKDAVQRVSFRDGGWNMLLRTINTHQHLGFGFCWMTCFMVYYVMFSYPWWNWLINQDRDTWASLVLYRDIWNSTPWFLWYLWHNVAVAIVAGLYMNFPFRVLAPTILLYPFYLAVFPLLWLLGRFGVVIPRYNVVKPKKKDE